MSRSVAMRGLGALGAALDTARATPTRRWLLQVVAAAAGLLLATGHWGGILIGGALVGLFAPSTRRAVLAGLCFGALSWVTFAGRLALEGALPFYLSSGPLVAVGIVAALGLGALGGLSGALLP